jgi:glycerol-3-phosphate dehydrogenase
MLPSRAADDMEADVVVIGGGATGTGIAWDMSLRGLSVVLVEKGDICSGTSGRYHGLLHSGARYATSDFATARECIAENAIVRAIAPEAIEDTGGIFALLPGDDAAHVDAWIGGCRAAGIPVREMRVEEARRREPQLTPSTLSAFEAPDAVCHSMILCSVLARAAEARGARILTYSRLEGFLRHAGRIAGVRAVDVRTGTAVDIHGRCVVNAAGPWAGAVAAQAGIELSLDLARGALVAFEGTLVRAVVQRLRPPDDGDALVPRGRVTIAGTTEVATADPSDRRVDAWERNLIQERLAALVPALSRTRIVHAWSAVRPLYDPRESGDAAHPLTGAPIDSGTRRQARTLSRSFAVIDHAKTHGVEGLVSIVGGKLATYRLMAEKTTDTVCRSLGVEVACTTKETRIA